MGFLAVARHLDAIADVGLIECTQRKLEIAFAVLDQ